MAFHTSPTRLGDNLGVEYLHDSRALKSRRRNPFTLDMGPVTLELSMVIDFFRGGIADRHCEILPMGRLRRAPQFPVCHKALEMFIVVRLISSHLLIFGRPLQV